jgi:hypothetical protein
MEGAPKKVGRKRKNDASTKEVAPAKKSKKKSTKKSQTQTDEEWQKYIKLQKDAALSIATGSKKKSVVSTATTTTTTTSSNEKNGTKTAAKQDNKKKKKKSNPLLKQREPCDLMRNEARSQELWRQVEEADKNNQQKALAINVMPDRSRQTVETLALGVEHLDILPVSYSDVDVGMTLKRLNYERPPPPSFPLQDLMGDQGFFSKNNEHVVPILKCIIKDKRNDMEWAKAYKASGSSSYSNASYTDNSRIKNASDKHSLLSCGAANNGDTCTKKLNHILGNSFYQYGYNRRRPEAQYKKMKILDSADRLERFKEFYKYDQLDEDETNYGEAPNNSKMFRKLRRENGEKFNRRNEQLRLSASLTPKADVEEVSKEQILEARQPPGTSDALCSNGVKCIFNTFSPDKTARYIGKVFYTEREKAKLLREQIEGKSIEMDDFDVNDDEEEEQWDSYNKHRLCIDCLFKRWTIQWAINISHESVPDRQINYFTVQCKPGQYSPHCMLSMRENNKPTGIVGNVPRFSLNNRRIVTHQRHRRTENKYETVSVPVLVETGMDF